MSLHFSKMHGIGNDFVIIDWRGRTERMSEALARRLADRHFGVGCDQLLTVENSSDPDCAFRYGIWNTDGSEAGQCGNGVRCVAAWLHREGLIGLGSVRLLSPSGPVRCERLADGRVRVEMGVPRFRPKEIPLRAAHASGSYRLSLNRGVIDVAAVSMGNPHAVIDVENVETADVAGLGAEIEAHTDFPERCNVGFRQIVARDAIRLRVFERGVGETLACGTGACAAVVTGIQAGVLDRQVRVFLPGSELVRMFRADSAASADTLAAERHLGDTQGRASAVEGRRQEAAGFAANQREVSGLLIEWPDPDGPVWMTGPAQFVFEGIWYDD